MSFLNKKLISFAEDVIGLDIGMSSVKVIQLEDKIIKNYGFKKIPEGVIVNGEIIKPDKLSEIIREVVAEAKPKRIKTKKVICSVPESRSFLRLISVPNMEKEELEEAIKWEIEANIPLSLDKVYYDWIVVNDIFSDNKDENRVLILATAKKIIDQMLEIIDNSGLEAVGIESESVALVRSLYDGKKNKKTVLFVELGQNKTTFVFAIKGVPCFTSSVPVSEQTIISQIAKKFNMSNEKARIFEEKNGLESFFDDEDLFSAIEPALENLVEEIKKTIDFYLGGLRYSDKIDDIIVCGKLSTDKKMINYLSKRLKKEIRMGSILSNLNKDKKIIPIIKNEIAVQYAIAIGLALGCGQE